MEKVKIEKRIKETNSNKTEILTHCSCLKVVDVAVRSHMTLSEVDV